MAMPTLLRVVIAAFVICRTAALPTQTLRLSADNNVAYDNAERRNLFAGAGSSSSGSEPQEGESCSSDSDCQSGSCRMHAIISSRNSYTCQCQKDSDCPANLPVCNHYATKANICSSQNNRVLINGGAEVYRELFGDACKALQTIKSEASHRSSRHCF